MEVKKQHSSVAVLKQMGVLTSDQYVSVLRWTYADVVLGPVKSNAVLKIISMWFPQDKVDAVYYRTLIQEPLGILSASEEITILECICYAGIRLASINEKEYSAWLMSARAYAGGYNGVKAFCGHLRKVGNDYLPEITERL
jgi:hypothetical protein